MQINYFVFAALVTLFSLQVNAQSSVEWNLKDRYGITQQGFNNIIDDARDYFTSSPDDNIIVYVDAGSYEIDGTNGGQSINLSGGLLFEEAKGKLIFQGAGMLETTLVFIEKGSDMMRGFDVYHLEFRDMTMTRTQHSVTQGTVVSVAPGEIVMDVDEGFPTPLELFSIERGGGRFNAGRYLRRYTKSTTDPLVIRENNRQIAWGWRDGAPVYPDQPDSQNHPNRWTFYLNVRGLDATTAEYSYKVGEYVGVKSKSEGNIYWFARGSDLVFRNIRWFHSSRGLVRGGFSNVGLYGCRIDRGGPINGQTPCLSTPSGGPQMNQHNDPLSTNMVVEDCYFDSPGDDNIAFFNVNGGKVKNTVIRNGFARGVLAIDKATNICLDNVTMENTYFEDGPLGVNHETEEEAIAAVGAYNCSDPKTQKASFGQLFTDDLILQRNTSAKIWGTGETGTPVTISTSWNGQTYNTTVDRDGKWSVFVNTPEGSYTAYTITLESPGTETTTIKNVLIGEVWLAAGQSNMVRPLRSSPTGDPDALDNQDTYFRLWKNRDKYADGSGFVVNEEPQEELLSSFEGWDRGDENSTNREFSAVAWYYGRQLRDNLDMPVGIIQSAVGSSSAEAWLDKETANQFDWLDVTAPFDGTQDQRKPASCYNGLIHPLVGFTIKGMIWYQGETGGNPLVIDQYKAMFQTLINSYRAKWGIGEFPFYMVNIVPYDSNDGPLEAGVFANMQRETFYDLGNTGMAATIDNPYCSNIHPPEKKFVGERLSFWALNKQYGFSDVVPSGPIVKTAELDGNTLKVYFDFAETALVDTSGTGLRYFEVAGEDGVYYPAEAGINDDNTLTLSSSSVTAPKSARYAYVACDLVEATLFNGAGLPAPQFLVSVDDQDQIDSGTAFDLQAFIDNELSAGETEIIVPPGRYRVSPTVSNNTMLLFEDLDNITIIADGVEMICTEKVQGMKIVNCNNFKVKGLTIDYDPLPYTQATITDISADKTQLTVKMIDGYPTLLTGDKLEIYDATSAELATQTYYGVSYEVVDKENGIVVITKPTRSFDNLLKLGDIAVMGSRGDFIPHTVKPEYCTNLFLEDVTVYASTSFSFLETNCTSSKYINCKVDRRPLETEIKARGLRRMRSGNADAFHSKHADIGPSYVGCVARYNGDDSYAINGSFHVITETNDNVLTVVAKGGRNNQTNIEIGDTIELISYAGERIPDAVVNGITAGRALNQTEIDFLTSRPSFRGAAADTYTANNVWLITVDRPVDLPMGSLINSANKVGNGFEVRDCIAGPNRSRGILVKAGNGIITGNTCVGNQGVAIKCSPEYNWFEAGSGSNIEISNNVINDCGNDAIEVFALGGDGNIPGAGAHDNIKIINNQVNNLASGRLAIYVTSTSNLCLEGNNYQVDEPEVELVNVEFGCIDIPLSLSSTNYSKNLTVSVYPNPTEDYVYISIPDDILNVEAQLFDLTGVTIANFTLTDSENRIDLSSYDSGIYILKILDRYVTTIHKINKR